MKIVDESIKHPVSVIVGIIFIILFGIIYIFKIPVQLTPDVEKPRITVDTTWIEGSPQEVESEIVRKQEDELKSVEGLVEMTSESADGAGSIILEFGVGTDLDAATLKVSNRLDQVKEYPLEADKPVIRSVDVRGSAMAWFILKPLPGKDIDIDTLHDFAEDFIKPRFERVPGVASSNVFGGQEREMQVIVDPDALAARGITLIENVVITRKNGVPVYVRDVASARLGYKDHEYAVRQNGEPAIAINALRETGANAINVMAGLREAMKELNEGLLKDRGLTLYNVYDETTYITSAIGLVKNKLII